MNRKVRSAAFLRRASLQGTTQAISCHDCRRSLAPSALACPHCGSLEPRGARGHIKPARRRLRREAQNDRNLALAITIGTIVGALLGWRSAGGFFSAFMLIGLYGLVGASIGASGAVAFNMLWPR